MLFEKENLYHIFNQGNNRQKIFFSQENYLFFLRKMKTHILPYADILAWCLMPNHFHLMVWVKEVEVAITEGFAPSEASGFITEGFALSEALGTERLALSEALGTERLAPSKAPGIKKRTFNQSIGIMLRAYTNAINKQNNTSGSLFRKQTKAECLNPFKGLTPSFYNTNKGTLIPVDRPELHHPKVCFDYIHQNPMKAGLVKSENDWEFSSARDYAGFRNGQLVNKKKAKELNLFLD
jgi:putative transposase